MEDFGGPTHETFPQEVIDAGTRLMQQMFTAWLAQHPGMATQGDGEDVVMADASADLPPEEQLAELRRCVEQFRPQIESNAWAQSLIASL